jgi:ribonuclease Y
VSAIWIGLAAALGAVGGFALAVAVARQKRMEAVRVAESEAAAALKSAQMENVARRAEILREAREAALQRRHEIDQRFEASMAELSSQQDELERRELDAGARRALLDDRKGEVSERERAAKKLRDRARSLRKDAEKRRETLRARLEELGDVGRDSLIEKLSTRWIEEARAEAAQLVRSVDQTAADPSYGREAQRLMAVATSRYRNHFLTERSISNLPVDEAVRDLLIEHDQRLLQAIAAGSNVQLHLNDEGTSVKLEGLDGVGREVARRALRKLARKPRAAEAAAEDPEAWCAKIRAQLDGEIQGLGKKAFSVLGVKKADPEIVTLVGKLNFRTSYTQNQWLHAVEAAFLAGMMAEEMGLDVHLARRATLMHDIGKALTHEIEGSHAVIGADIARRVGEDEIVANAIGSHHADEPPNSVYAFLVAAADAMSGARPGARREHTDGYSTRLEDLERIGSSYRGVESCYAVHGGRELRIYVRDAEISDLDAVDLSSEIAAQISEEMTFPGQVKVTVIRSTEVVSVAT